MKFLTRPKVIFSLLMLVLLLLGVTATPILSKIPAKASGVSDLSAQLQAVYSSQDGVTLRGQMATLLSNPSVATLASNMLTQNGGDLTAFQKDLLKAVIAESSYSDITSKILAGTPLTAQDKQRKANIHQQLANNPSIQKLISTAAQLKGTSTLSQDITGVLTRLNGPTPNIGTTGQATLDSVLVSASTAVGGSSFNTLKGQVAGILADPGAGDFVSSQRPEVIASLIPSATLDALLLPNDRDPPIPPAVKATFNILAGFAVIAGVILLAPEELTVGAIVGVGLGIFAGLVQIVNSTDDLAQALDCDHDGDPWDSSDVPGIEC